jgi:NAD(P)H-dependent FMN reductase
MRFFIVTGSPRTDSQSGRIGRYIEQLIAAQHPAVKTNILDLGRTPMPLWNESMWSDTPQGFDDWLPVSKQLSQSDALVVVTPEWGGMVPPALTNFLLLCRTELVDKPGLIVSVSAGTGGSYPVAQLRMNSCKNTHLCYIPEHVIIREVRDLFNNFSQPASATEQFLTARLLHALALLEVYAHALLEVQNSGARDLKHFPFGM